MTSASVGPERGASRRQLQQSLTVRGDPAVMEPLRKLHDEQIEEALRGALARDDAPFIKELIDELQRRGHVVEI